MERGGLYTDRNHRYGLKWVGLRLLGSEGRQQQEVAVFVFVLFVLFCFSFCLYMSSRQNRQWEYTGMLKVKTALYRTYHKLMPLSTAGYLNPSAHTSTLTPSNQLSTESVTSTDISACSIKIFLCPPSCSLLTILFKTWLYFYL